MWDYYMHISLISKSSSINEWDIQPNSNLIDIISELRMMYLVSMLSRAMMKKLKCWKKEMGNYLMFLWWASRFR
jgi:hypothetical protein